MLNTKNPCGNFQHRPNGLTCKKEAQLEKARMMRRLGAVLLGTLLVGALSWPASTRAGGTEEMKLRVGDAAPDFKLQYFDGKDLKDVRLSDYRDKKNVVLAFYIFAFTGG
jgi:AhpC/TSA family